ncbi:MAG: penicillin acylase family protein, partial [Gammaproteobacteria bacterium]
LLCSSLPELEGEITLRGLSAPVTILSDRYAIPDIEADNRLDAFRALGFVTARDRMVQLELFRRLAEGSMAEVFGFRFVALDRYQRLFGFSGVARRVLQRLPEPQRALLFAYARGINAYLEQNLPPPPEFVVLGIEASAWQPEDSLLVALTLFQALNFTAHQEAMLTVMSHTLPEDVVAFLTPDSDRYSETLVGGSESRRPQVPLPAASLGALYRSANRPLAVGARIAFDDQFGSNGWVVNRRKTQDGRAILANDMHLPLIVPNLWYRARLHYPDATLSGITLPGLPLLVSGSNNHVAWGYTNALADVIDLVTLEINPQNENEYAGPAGWLPFQTTHETIRVRGSEDVHFSIRHTVWGPVAEKTLLGKLTALHWTALDPGAVDLGLIDLDRTKNVGAAIAVFNRAGLPVLNVMLADAEGSIGWTLTGKIPKRRGFDGSVSLPWGTRSLGWNGYLQPDELPRIQDPESGYIATANNRVIGKGFPYPVGQNFANGYRAARIRERLSTMQKITEKNMLALQGDTRTEFYDFYRDLALSALREDILRQNPRLARIKRYLAAWEGRAKAESPGIGVLFNFRRRLAGAIILPLLKECYAADEAFYYSWFNMDTPLRQILSARPADMLPRKGIDRNWDDLILRVLVETVDKLETRHGVQDINRLTWSEINPVRITHPLSRAVPALAEALDLPEYPLSGCTFCINVVTEGYGVTERLVVSPGHHEAAFLEMPGGQSAHPLSEHYRDQHVFWARVRAMPLEPEPRNYRLRLIP